MTFNTYNGWMWRSWKHWWLAPSGLPAPPSTEH